MCKKTSETLPSLWQQFYSSDLASNANIFEVYSDYESDADCLYTISVSAEKFIPLRLY